MCRDTGGACYSFYSSHTPVFLSLMNTKAWALHAGSTQHQGGCWAALDAELKCETMETRSVFRSLPLEGRSQAACMGGVGRRDGLPGRVPLRAKNEEVTLYHQGVCTLRGLIQFKNTVLC